MVFPRVGRPTRSNLDRRKEDPDNYRDLSNAVRHLTYHMFPVRSSQAVEWNIDQLHQRWHLFNGIRVLGVNISEATYAPDDLLQMFRSLGIEWDHVIVRDNNPGLGEVMTWIPSIGMLTPESASDREIVFSAHAKGVKYSGNEMPAVIRDWSSVMYSVNLDDWKRVQQSLEWFAATGAFRVRYPKCDGCQHGWFYSGAFWWWRLADIAKHNWNHVSPWYAGRETWIGDKIERHESDCLFMDASRSPYLAEYWRKKINPRWEKYQEERLNHAR